MSRIRVVNKTREGVLGTRVQVADRWWQRVRGFLGRGRPADGEGILLSPCRAVHMIGIGFPLDVVFIDREGVVQAVYPSLRPGRMTRFHRSAEYALELPAGTIVSTGTVVADRIAWMPGNGAAVAAADGVGAHSGGVQ
jgi:uncharacterized membrane protein (UPF0127 family)